jgi:hypothetical protein
MLNYFYLAQTEHRARVDRFNMRAARGDFVRHEVPVSNGGVRGAERLRDLVLVLRNQWLRTRVQSLLTRAG